MMTHYLNTDNESFGFYGTVGNCGVDPELAWEEMSCYLIECGWDKEQVQTFLDGTWGRHLADRFCDEWDKGAVLEEAATNAVYSYGPVNVKKAMESI